MAGNIYVPPYQPQGYDTLAQVITKLALAKMAMNFKEQQSVIEANRKSAEKAREETTQAKKEGWRVAEGEEQRAPESGAIDIYGTKMMPPTPETMEIPGTKQRVIKWGDKFFSVKVPDEPKVITVAGKPAVIESDGTIKFVPDKTPTQNPNVWQNIVNDPNATPAEKAIAQKNLIDMEERQKRIVGTSGVARAAGYKGLTAIQVANPETGEVEWRWAGEAIPGFPQVPGMDFAPGGKAGKPSALSPQTPVFAAGKSALSQMEAQEAKVLAFAETAEKNLGIALKLSDKVDRTGVPVINRWLLAGKKSLAGDKDVAAFDAALRVGINEFARVTTTATGGGVTSDQARKEVEDMLKNALTPQQIKEVVTEVLLPDMQNRKAGYNVQRQRILRGLATQGPQTEQPTRPRPPLSSFEVK